MLDARPKRKQLIGKKRYLADSFREGLIKHDITPYIPPKANLKKPKQIFFEYIKGFYNPTRRYSYLCGGSPLAFKAKAA